MNLYNKAIKLGASDFGESNKSNKRFFVIYDNHLIHFGSKTGSTFYDHGNKKLKINWYKRHSQIKNKQGETVINNPYSASFWSANLLW
jgi:hypothetical protein